MNLRSGRSDTLARAAGKASARCVAKNDANRQNEYSRRQMPRRDGVT
jgi:hypothetical protein